MASKLASAALGLALVLAGGCALAAADGEAAVAAFMARFEAMEAREARGEAVDWLGPGSPFRPYLARPFSEGLNTQEAARYRRSSEALDCRAMAELEIAGFRRLYPELGPALADARVVERLGDEVRWQRSTPYMLCLFSETVRDANIRALEGVVELPLRPGGENGSLDLVAIPGPDSRLLLEFEAIRTIIDFAICRDHAPAFAALIEIIDAARLVVLPPAEEYYVRGRAAQLGITSAHSGDRNGLRLSASHLARLDAAIASGDVAHEEGPISGWSAYCERALKRLPFDPRSD